MSNVYDATKEHTPFDKSKASERKGRHPNKKLKTKNPYTGNYSRYAS